MHGYSHEYKLINNSWIPEMIWKSEEQLYEELGAGKKLLEETFDTNIKVLVAPNNSVDCKGIHVAVKLGMDFSGIIYKNDRDITFKYMKNFVKRWYFRLINKIPYPGVLDYGDHKELVAYTLDDYDRLVKEYKMCKNRDAPFVVYSHYWKINENAKVKALMCAIYNYAIKDGASLIGLSKCFK